MFYLNEMNILFKFNDVTLHVYVINSFINLISASLIQTNILNKEYYFQILNYYVLDKYLN